MERTVIGSVGGPLVFDTRRASWTPATTAGEEEPAGVPTKSMTLADLEQMERDIILQALEESKGRIYGDLGAAAKLDLRPTTLTYRIKKLNVPNRHRPASIRWSSKRLLR